VNEAAEVQNGTVSVVRARVPRRRKPVRVPRPSLGAGPTTLGQRARLELAELARAQGLVCDVEQTRDIDRPHIHLRTKNTKIFGKIKVMQTKFQIRDHLNEARSFARLEGPDALPVVWHKRNGMPILAIMTATDFFKIVAEAER